MKVNIIEEDDHLVAEASGEEKLIVNAESETDFFVIGQYLKAHFKKDKDGKIVGFQEERYNGKQSFKKIN